jgi:hypothetical protein
MGFPDVQVRREIFGTLISVRAEDLAKLSSSRFLEITGKVTQEREHAAFGIMMAAFLVAASQPPLVDGVDGMWTFVLTDELSEDREALACTRLITAVLNDDGPTAAAIVSIQTETRQRASDTMGVMLALIGTIDPP